MDDELLIRTSLLLTSRDVEDVLVGCGNLLAYLPDDKETKGFRKLFEACDSIHSIIERFENLDFPVNKNVYHLIEPLLVKLDEIGMMDEFLRDLEISEKFDLPEPTVLKYVQVLRNHESLLVPKLRRMALEMLSLVVGVEEVVV